MMLVVNVDIVRICILSEKRTAKIYWLSSMIDLSTELSSGSGHCWWGCVIIISRVGLLYTAVMYHFLNYISTLMLATHKTTVLHYKTTQTLKAMCLKKRQGVPLSSLCSEKFLDKLVKNRPCQSDSWQKNKLRLKSIFSRVL